MKGIVAWFSSAKGYGFISPHGGGKDVFCHWSAVKGEGFKTLIQGQRVTFDITTRESDGKELAANVVPLDFPAEGVHHGRRAAADR